MTNSELNRDIKRLYNKIESLKNKDNNKFFEYIENEGNKEFKRLYYADNKAEVLTLKSLKIMMVLNRRFNYVAHHTFYINIEL